MKKILCVIDMQPDFCHSSAMAKEVLQHIQDNAYDRIIFTIFKGTNKSFLKKLNYQGVKDENAILLPCLQNIPDAEVLYFNTYAKYLNVEEDDMVYLCGMDTDACVLATAFHLFDKGIDVHILSGLCWSSSRISDMHDKAMDIIHRNMDPNA